MTISSDDLPAVCWTGLLEELEAALVRLECLTAIVGMEGKSETFSDLYDARAAVRNATNRERSHSSNAKSTYDA